MPFIEWSDNYLTGIPDIDKEHRGLFALINDLYDKVKAGSAETSVKATIEALVVYVNFHFAREEGLMDACGYPDRESHKAEHRKLQSQMEAFSRSYENHPQSFDLADFMGFLTYWLKGHILQSDMAYIPYVEGRVESIVSHPSNNLAS